MLTILAVIAGAFFGLMLSAILSSGKIEDLERENADLRAQLGKHKTRLGDRYEPADRIMCPSCHAEVPVE